MAKEKKPEKCTSDTEPEDAEFQESLERMVTPGRTVLNPPRKPVPDSEEAAGREAAPEPREEDE